MGITEGRKVSSSDKGKVLTLQATQIIKLTLCCAGCFVAAEAVQTYRSGHAPSLPLVGCSLGSFPQLSAPRSWPEGTCSLPCSQRWQSADWPHHVFDALQPAIRDNT